MIPLPQIIYLSQPANNITNINTLTVEPSSIIQPIHNLPIRLLPLPLRHRRRHNLRLLRRPQRVPRHKSPLQRPQNRPLLLHARLLLACLRRLHRRHPNQHRRLRRRRGPPSPRRRAVHLQHQLFHRRDCVRGHVLDFNSFLPRAGD
jgi:hypothetical protein